MAPSSSYLLGQKNYETRTVVLAYKNLYAGYLVKYLLNIYLYICASACVYMCVCVCVEDENCLIKNNFRGIRLRLEKYELF